MRASRRDVTCMRHKIMTSYSFLLWNIYSFAWMDILILLIADSPKTVTGKIADNALENLEHPRPSRCENRGTHATFTLRHLSWGVYVNTYTSTGSRVNWFCTDVGTYCLKLWTGIPTKAVRFSKWSHFDWVYLCLEMPWSLLIWTRVYVDRLGHFGITVISLAFVEGAKKTATKLVTFFLLLHPNTHKKKKEQTTQAVQFCRLATANNAEVALV